MPFSGSVIYRFCRFNYLDITLRGGLEKSYRALHTCGLLPRKDRYLIQQSRITVGGCEPRAIRSSWKSFAVRRSSSYCTVKSKFHYTGPTAPDRARADRTDFFARAGPQTRVSDKVRGLCLVGSGRARVVEFLL